MLCLFLRSGFRIRISVSVITRLNFLFVVDVGFFGG